MKKYFILLCFLLQFFLTEAQTHPIQVNILIPNPTAPFLSDYIGLESQVVITLTNNGNETRQVKLAGSFLRNVDNYGVRTRANYAPSIPIVILPGQMLTMTPLDLEAIYESNALEPVGGASLNDFIRNPVLTEGIYQLCISAYDYTVPGYSEANILSNPLVPACGMIIPIITSEPMLLQVQGMSCDIEDRIIVSSETQNIVFTWSPSVPMTQPIAYEFTLLEFPSHISDPNFLFNHPPAAPIEQGNAPGLQYTLFNADGKLIPGQRYAFRIRAFSEGQPLAFRNGGISLACSFYYGEPVGHGSGLTLSCHWPADGDTIPFRPLYFVTDFAPYSEDYINYDIQFRLNRGGSQINNYNRNLNWPRGPRRTQSESLGEDISEDRSRFIIFSNPNHNLYSLDRMDPHLWQGTGSMRVRGRSDLAVGTCQSAFTVGMGRPQPISPAHESRVQPGNVSLSFRTANAPRRLLPIYPDLMQAEGRRSYSFFMAYVRERWVLEVSRTEGFGEVIYRHSSRLPIEGSSDPNSESELVQMLYKSEQTEQAFTELGDYFWRIRWLSDPDGPETGSSYLDSEIFKFTISNDPIDGGGDDDPDDPSENVCGSDCNAPEIPVSKRVASNSAMVGDSIKVGRFMMKLKEVQYSGDRVSGKGEMKIGIFRAPIKVKFDGIEINSDKEMYSGEIFAEIEEEVRSLIPGLDRGIGATGVDSTGGKFIHDFVNNASRLVSQFSSENPIALPIGWDQVIEEHRFTLGIIGMKFTPRQGTMNVMFSYNFPEFNGWLSFGADDICFHDRGLANLSQITIYNPTDRIFGYPNSDSTARFVIKGSPPGSNPVESTHLSVDCNGFKEFRIVGYFEFPRTVFLPDSINGLIGNGNVKAHFNFMLRKKGDIIFNVRMEAFQFPGLADFGFGPVTAWVDLSSEENPTGMSFPSDYAALGGITGKQWKGFFMPSIAMRFKIGGFDEEEERSSTIEKRSEIGIYNIIWDDKLTFRVSAVNLVRFDQTDYDGWQLSVDSLYLDVMRSNFRSVGFTGRLKIPLSDTATLKYTAALTREVEGEGESRDLGNVFFQFNVTVADSLRLSHMGVVMHLERNSFVEFRVGSSRSGLTADFTGNLGVTQSTGGPATDIRGIRFENFRLKTWESDRNEIISVRNIRFTSPEKKVNNFPIQIEDWKIDVRTEPVNIGDDASKIGPRIGLQLKIKLRLLEGSNVFEAGTTIGVYTRFLTSTRKFEFAGVHLECVNVRGGNGAVTIGGEVCIYSNHSTYGDGFRGKIEVFMKPGLDVEATVQFGKVGETRYLFVDAKVEFGEGQRITLFPALAISGFAGGFYINMRKEGDTPYEMLDTGSAGPGEHSNEPGRTMSATRYVPDTSGGWGLKAGIFFKPPAGEAYRAMVQFELEFSGQAFRRFMLRGDLVVLSKEKNATNAPIRATLVTEYNDETKIFTLNAEIFVNVLNILTGVGPNNRAGYIDMYVNGNSGDWFIHIGKPLRNPEDRCGISVIGLFEINSYIMTGKNLPGMPPPPPQIIRVLNEGGINYNPNRVGINPDLGDGFAMGAMMSARLDIQPFPLRFYLGFTFGFDISLRKTNARCRDTGRSIGFNDGWYATGQIYAHIEGRISLYINLFFFQAEAVIFSAEMAAVLSGGFPNPSWVYGAAAGNYQLFGGKIKGRWRTEFEFGTVCPLDMGSPFDDMEIISEMTPTAGERVDADVIPATVFNFEINGEFEVEEAVPGPAPGSEPSIVVRRFRVNCDTYNIRFLTGPAQQIPHRTVVDARDPFLIKLIPDGYLPLGIYRTDVSASADEFFSGQGWRPVRNRATNAVIKENKWTWFIVPTMPDTLNDRDIRYTYPYRNQRFFLQNECRNGMISVARNASEILDPRKGLTSDFEWRFRIELMDMTTGEVLECSGFNMAHLGSGTTIRFLVPDLQNERMYSVRLVKRKTHIRPQQGQGNGFNLGNYNDPRFSGFNALSENQMRTIVQNVRLNQNTRMGEHTMEQRRIDGKSINSPNDLLVYQFYFRSSKYNTASAKVAQFHSLNVRKQNELGNISSHLVHEISRSEAFDVFDVKPYVFTHHALPSVQYNPPFYFNIVWGQSGNRWLFDYAEKKIYEAYRIMRNSGCLPGNPPLGNLRQDLRHSTLRHPILSIEVDENYIQAPITPPPPPSNPPGSNQHSGYSFNPAGNGIQGNFNFSIELPHTIFKYYPRSLPLVPSDLSQVKSYAARVRSNCGGEFLSRDLDILTRTVLAQDNIDYSIGVYPYRIFFNRHVFMGCPNLDYTVPPLRIMQMSYRP